MFLQDWTSIEGTDTTAFTQARPDWLDLSQFGDVVLWLEVRAITNPGAGSVTLTYETAPSSDESLFQAIATSTVALTSSPAITKVRLGDNPAVPLGRYLRWKMQGTATGSWHVSFRILVTPGKGSFGGFDPSQLALTGWWRGSYGGLPWTGTASAGASGGLQLTTSTTDPTVGSALNGFTPASFNGTSSKMGSSIDIGNLVSASAASVVVLFNAAAATTDTGAATWYDMPALLAPDGATRFGVVYSSSGVRIGNWDGSTWNSLAVGASTGSWHLAQMTYDGSQFRGRVDSSGYSTLARGNAVLSAANAMVGPDPDLNTHFFNGLIMEIIVSNTVISDPALDSIKSYVNARYGLSL